MNSLFSSKKTQPLLFGLPRFGAIFFHSSLVILALPLIVVKNAGENSKGLHLGLITGDAALLSVGILYVFGIYRDRKSRIQQGWNYPLYSLILSLPALFIISLSGQYTLLIFAFFILIISRSLCESSHLAILTDYPDLKNRENYTSGIALGHFLGTGLAALAFGFSPQIHETFGLRQSSWLGVLCIFMVLISITGFYFAFSRKGKNQNSTPQMEEKTIPFKIPISLIFLILARLFMLTGIMVISTFLVYVVRDFIGYTQVEKNTSILFSLSLLGSVISSVPMGKAVERKGEIPVLFFSGVSMALVTIVFFLFGPTVHEINIPCMLIYGAGFAGLISAGLSLTVKLIPHPQLAGRIMAVITASTFVAQFLASISGAAVLDPLNRIKQGLGYFFLFAVMEIYFILGGFFLYKVKRKEGL
jgi:MFS family permease